VADRYVWGVVYFQ